MLHRISLAIVASGMLVGCSVSNVHFGSSRGAPLTVVADSKTVIPETKKAFQSFDSVCTSNGHVFFAGKGGGTLGLYRARGGDLPQAVRIPASIKAKPGDSKPLTRAEFRVLQIDAVHCDDGNQLVFLGDIFKASANDRVFGLSGFDAREGSFRYLESPHSRNASLVDFNEGRYLYKNGRTYISGRLGHYPTNLSLLGRSVTSAAIDGQHVAYIRGNAVRVLVPNEKGKLISRILCNTSTKVPGSNKTFTSFRNVRIDAGNLVFHGVSGRQQGLYIIHLKQLPNWPNTRAEAVAAALKVVADNFSHPLNAKQQPLFQAVSDPRIDGSQVAFIGHRQTTQGHRSAIWMHDGSRLRLVAQSGDAAPNGLGYFQRFPHLAIGEGTVVFQAISSKGRGVYRTGRRSLFRRGNPAANRDLIVQR